MNYYYLAASLPPLVLGEAPQMPTAEFIDQCRDQLLPDDFRVVASIFADPGRDAEHGPLAVWSARETQLRNAVAAHRARTRQQDPAEFVRPHEGFEPDIEKGVADAFALATPLDRELALDAIRWRTADELAGMSEFTGTAIVAYGLKLKLAARWAAMDEEAGASQADELITMPIAGAEDSVDQQET